ncbi:heterokaryon incompatibility protein-domain-containing protein [Nemania sp. FL0916]|nr:heterokaryon incompatibility protein-domain-containing protein [Nemania sp. FL0916]
MVCQDCARLLEHGYTTHIYGTEPVAAGVRFSRSLAQVRECASATGPKFCIICRSLARHFPFAVPVESVGSWKKIVSIGSSSTDVAYYVAVLAEIKQPQSSGQENQENGSPKTFVLSLCLERVGNHVFNSPMQSKRSQRFVSTYLLVPASRATEFCSIPRGIGENEEQGQPNIERRVGISTGSIEALDMAKNWLNQCLKHHTRCPNIRAHSQSHANTFDRDNIESYYPTRLVEILSQTSRLHTTASSIEDSTMEPGGRRDYQYATLSHRWPSDGERLLQLTTSNIELWHHEIDQDTGFSKSFSDAITVCRHLGIKYIWIDSLCIIQKGDGGQDWQKEAACMGSIYKRSICNIAATSVTDGDEGIAKGFFRPRYPSMIHPNIISARSNLDSLPRVEDGLINRIRKGINIQHTKRVNYHILPAQQLEYDVIQTPLNKRGWIVQERHMSPRILHFSKKQIYWECNEVVCSEMYPKRDPVNFYSRGSRTKRFIQRLNMYQKMIDMLPSDIPLRLIENSAHHNGLSSGLYTLWYDMIAVYSKCSLTKKSDKLLAIAGMAREISTRLKISETDYVAGLWRQDLLYGLLWRGYYDRASGLATPVSHEVA